MLGWLKKYFIPHEGNEHKPHVLRTEAMLVILAAALFGEIVFLAGTEIVLRKSDFFAAILPQALVDSTNRNRETQTLPPLIVNDLLEKAAYQKAEDMVSRAYFSHNTPDGRTPWYWLEEVGYRFGYAGENLAINFADSEDVVTAWMNSLSHRANILNKNFTEIGIGAARGMYQGRETVFVVQFFGRPAPTSIIVPALARVPVAQASQAPETAPPVETAIPPSQPVRLPSEMYVVTKNTSAPSAEAETLAAESRESENNQAVQTANQTNRTETSLLKKALSSPRVSANFLYAVLFTIILLALVLNVFIKINVQHPQLVINGVLLLMFIASTLLVNKYLLLLGARVF